MNHMKFSEKIYSQLTIVIKKITAEVTLLLEYEPYYVNTPANSCLFHFSQVFQQLFHILSILFQKSSGTKYGRAFPGN